MLDERAFIAEVEAASPDQFARLLIRPSPDEERALRAHFGDERYQRLHGMALRRSVRGVTRQPKGNLVFLHGIMGGELTTTNAAGNASEHVWARVFALVRGRAARLRLDEDGLAEFDRNVRVRATGIMKRSYGEALLTLGERWNVQAFWYDWRKSLTLAAADLEARINEWFGPDAPVHLVAHSMGGLVARTFILNQKRHWDRMKKTRLVMLGTPNHGSFAIPQVITGLEGMVRKLALVDLEHGLDDLLPVFNSFVGSYQMLPSPFQMSGIDWLYEAESYLPIHVPQPHLDAARKHHEALRKVVDPDRMTYIAGYNRATFDGLTRKAPADKDAYSVTFDGDGRVPHKLGLLDGVTTHYVEETHGDLAGNPAVLVAVEELLESGETTALTKIKPKVRAKRGLDDAREDAWQAQEDDIARFTKLAQRARTRGAAAAAAGGAGTAPALAAATTAATTTATTATTATTTAAVTTPAAAAAAAALQVSPMDREIEEELTRGFLSSPRGRTRTPLPRDPALPSDEDGAAAAAVRPETGGGPRRDTVRLEIAVLLGGIEEAHSLAGQEPPVDALAVGHYYGVKPQYAEAALDRAISGELLRAQGRRPRTASGDIPERDRLIAQYSERGIVRGELGQPFFITDPRHSPGADRVIALAGMGLPGRFGEPELTVLVRELCWALGRLGKQHLATVLIGSGAGNLDVPLAVSGWLRGFRHAITTAKEDEARRLRRVTFMDNDPLKIRKVRDAFAAAIAAAARHVEGEPEERSDPYDALTFTLVAAPTDKELEKLEDEGAKAEVERQIARIRNAGPRRALADSASSGKDPVATRITLGLDGDTYRFGAITETASIPERDVALDPALVMKANDVLVSEDVLDRQEEHGRFLGMLLVPEDLRSQLTSTAPIVMMLDAATARIHWEMVAYNEVSNRRPGSVGADAVGRGLGDFLGTSRGFTRQLRTSFAPPPEPPPPPRRVLRVLVVADPAADAHLPGAEEEGNEVADLFESFNTAYPGSSDNRDEPPNRVEVVRLFGPTDATRVRVMEELSLRSYDVLHYAGHCVFDEKHPSSSGWIFTNGERLSARELQRIDRVPKFIFSNACESGITPERVSGRSAAMAPSFAEAFFARGVANFVCTAWPIDDTAARIFARRLYCSLIGLEESPDRPGRYTAAPHKALPMHAAMREARLAIAHEDYGVTTWGAYQHYGNPFLRLFDSETLRAQAGPAGVGTGGGGAAVDGAGGRERGPSDGSGATRSARKRGATRGAAKRGTTRGRGGKR